LAVNLLEDFSNAISELVERNGLQLVGLEAALMDVEAPWRSMFL
jgi:hypothetical protein